jgi:hypothetical protein
LFAAACGSRASEAIEVFGGKQIEYKQREKSQ